MKKTRRSEVIEIGDRKIGGENPVLVQSMTNTDTRDVDKTVGQIKKLEKIGCEIIRVAVPDMKAAKTLGKIKKAIDIPLVADIHFDYKLALQAINQGVDKLRLNPGNITKEKNISKIARSARSNRIPIRVGVNSGSLAKDILNRYGGVTPEGMVESALEEIQLLENNDFHQIVVSLKSPSVPLMIEANRLIASKIDYPLHLGVTEAGAGEAGIIKSSLGIGTLLEEGIGDTIRVSLTGHPRKEVTAGWEIIRSLELREKGIQFISCPTCGRMGINLENILKETKKRLPNFKNPLKVAIMGCLVNGLGEARSADVALVGGKGKALIYQNGQKVKKVSEKEAVETLVELILSYDQTKIKSRGKK